LSRIFSQAPLNLIYYLNFAAGESSRPAPAESPRVEIQQGRVVERCDGLLPFYLNQAGA